MRIPHRVDDLTLEVYAPAYESLWLTSEVGRKLKSEDFFWDKDVQPTLVTLCLRKLLKMFEKHQYLKEISGENCDILLETLPTTLPLELTIPVIPDGIYWKRSYFERWKVLNAYSREKITWKARYLERHMQDYLESVQPEHYEEAEMMKFYALCTPYVNRLWLRELQQEKFRPAETVTERVMIHHVNFNNVLKYLYNVTQFDLIFGPRNIGERFTFGLYKLSVEDCKNLADGINCMPMMKIFRVHRSWLTDAHVQALIQTFVTNETLVELDFSHCKIANKGAFYFAELIRNHPTLEVLKLCNNLISNEGIVGITYVLQTTNICPLRHLDLRLNPLGSDGFRTLFSALIRNDEKPAELILAGIGFTEETAFQFGAVILPLNKSLRVLDISGNVCGVLGGESIANGLNSNTHILKFDARLCGFSKDSEDSIRQSLYRNDCFARKRPWSEDDIIAEEEVEIASIDETPEVQGDESGAPVEGEPAEE